MSSPAFAANLCWSWDSTTQTRSAACWLAAAVGIELIAAEGPSVTQACAVIPDLLGAPGLVPVPVPMPVPVPVPVPWELRQVEHWW